MNVLRFAGAIALFSAVALASQKRDTLIVTTSNATNNQLLVYNTQGMLLSSIPTNGKGGVSGNAGGIAVHENLVAVVNFGSQSVSIFERTGNGFNLRQQVPAASSPVSVAFGNDHLYVLGTTKVESHRIFGSAVAAGPDGIAGLLKADGSAAQVGVVPNALVITEKSNAIETVALNGDGAITGQATLVQNIPANVNAPFGLVTRGNNAYVTIAHADETSLVRNGVVLTTTPTSAFSGPPQHAPCWLTLVGPFMFSSNSPSKTISRYAVYGQKIVPDLDIAATLNGAPSDIASAEHLVAVVDGSGNTSHLSVFAVDEDGNLTLQGSATIANPANGVAVIAPARDND